MRAIGIDAISYVGTTLLSMILGSHPQCRSVGHCYLFFGKYREKKKYILEKDNVCEICDLLDIDCSLNKLKEAKHVQDPYEFIREGEEIIIDSSSVSEWFKWSNPDKIIYMFRNPVSLLSSYFKSLGRSQKTIEYMCNAYIRKYSGARGLAIEYRNILSDTPALRNLFKALDLEFSPEYLKYWNYSNHMVGGSKSVLISIAKYRCPEKAESIIKKAAHNNKDYIQYYRDDFNGSIDIATPKDKTQVMLKCEKVYKYLQSLQDVSL